MIIREINLDGEIVEREIDTVEEMKHHIHELENELRNLELTLTLVTAKELSTVSTHDLRMELLFRESQAFEKAEKYDKLLEKHRKAGKLVSRLKQELDLANDQIASLQSELCFYIGDGM